MPSSQILTQSRTKPIKRRITLEQAYLGGIKTSVIWYNSILNAIQKKGFLYRENLATVSCENKF